MNQKKVRERVVQDRDVPPVARGVVCVDFDGTLFSWGELHVTKPPFPGAVAFMKKLREEGWRIVIFTSRMSKTWWDAEGFTPVERRKQRTWVRRALRINQIPYDLITSEKVPASMYIDDKAIEFDINNGGWEAVHRRVFG